ncbi:hypothetical protein E4U52_004459 [Claviceps spartinae]|nr:hypothetical protein E4U52_004459 [Claviceps spartinae]
MSLSGFSIPRKALHGIQTPSASESQALRRCAIPSKSLEEPRRGIPTLSTAFGATRRLRFAAQKKTPCAAPARASREVAGQSAYHVVSANPRPQKILSLFLSSYNDYLLPHLSDRK